MAYGATNHLWDNIVCGHNLITGIIMSRYLNHDSFQKRTWIEVDEPWVRVSLGTGDALALAGLTFALAKKHGHIEIPCWNKSVNNVRSIYHRHPEITVKPLEDFTSLFGRTDIGSSIFIGYEKDILPRDSKVDYYEYVYNLFGVDYEERWTDEVDDAAFWVDQEEIPDRPYAFVHSDPERGMEIDESRINPELMIYRPTFDKDTSILAYCELLMNAREIHVFDSCFWWLCEAKWRSLLEIATLYQPQFSVKLFCHRYARHFISPWNDYKSKLPWTIVL